MAHVQQQSPAEPAVHRAGRLAGMDVSLILQVGAKARAARARGRDVLDLGVGEPDFDTPDHVKEAAARAMWDGQTKYTPLGGTPALKAAVADKFRRENGLDFAPEEIIVGAGAKQILFNAFMATLDPGDEVIIPAPYWTSYLDIVRISGGTPVVVETRAEEGFRLGAAALRAAITPRTRWLLLNAPGNPSGMAYDEASLAALLEVVAAYPQVWVLSDDIYEHILYDGARFATAAAVAPHLKGRILTVNGVSKAYAMTGWRIGYGAGPRRLIDAMAVVQSQSTSCPSSVSQAAALAALTGPQDFVAHCVDMFRQRRDAVSQALESIPGLACARPQGAFYLFPSCAGLLGKRTPDDRPLASAIDVADYLLEAADVAVVPGEAFGTPGHFRISYACASALLEEACRRIHRACLAVTGVK